MNSDSEIIERWLRRLVPDKPHLTYRYGRWMCVWPTGHTGTAPTAEMAYRLAQTLAEPPRIVF